MRKLVFFLFCFLVSAFYPTMNSLAAGNIHIQSYAQAKKFLEREVYRQDDERITLYCEAHFDTQKNITLPQGFSTQKHKKRAQRVEWEHVVPAENFGRTFKAWREGDALCKDKQGKTFKGRKCAERVSEEYRLMQADMYNLYPSIGAVNASRSNYNFAMLPHAQSDFGICLMKIDSRKVEPPEQARGKIARAYLYMESAYPRYTMSKSQRKLMQAWSNMYPVTQDECTRTRRIEAVQGNENSIVKKHCMRSGLWELIFFNSKHPFHSNH